jgi:hypothetical protein
VHLFLTIALRSSRRTVWWRNHQPLSGGKHVQFTVNRRSVRASVESRSTMSSSLTLSRIALITAGIVSADSHSPCHLMPIYPIIPKTPASKGKGKETPLTMPTTRTTRARAAASNQDTPDAAVKSSKIPQTARKASADKIQEGSRPPSRQVSGLRTAQACV